MLVSEKLKYVFDVVVYLSPLLTSSLVQLAPGSSQSWHLILHPFPVKSNKL